MRQNEMPGCCRVGILHNFPGNDELFDEATKKSLADAVKREMSYHPVNLAILVKDIQNDDDNNQTNALAVLEKLGFVTLGLFVNDNTENTLALLAHGLKPTDLPTLPKVASMTRTHLTEEDLENIESNEFPDCCGAEILYEFPVDEDKEEFFSGVIEGEKPLVLMALRSDQTRAMATALDSYFVPLGTFDSVDRGKTITLFATGLDNPRPVKAPRKKRATTTAVRRRAA